MTRENAIKESGPAAKCYYCIVKFVEENGFPPTIDELKALAGIGSKRTTIKYLKKLQELRLIEVELKKARAISVRGYKFVLNDTGLEYGEKLTVAK